MLADPARRTLPAYSDDLGCCAHQPSHGHKGCTWPSGTGTPDPDCHHGCLVDCSADLDDPDDDTTLTPPRDRFRNAVSAAQAALDDPHTTVPRATAAARLRAAETALAAATAGVLG